MLIFTFQLPADRPCCDLIPSLNSLCDIERWREGLPRLPAVNSQSNHVDIHSFTVTQSGNHGEQEVCSGDGFAWFVLLKKRKSLIFQSPCCCPHHQELPLALESCRRKQAAQTDQSQQMLLSTDPDLAIYGRRLSTYQNTANAPVMLPVCLLYQLELVSQYHSYCSYFQRRTCC